MGNRIRTWVSRACLIGAAALTIVALVAPPTSAQPAGAPAAFGATGFASAIQAMINTDPQTFVADLVRFDVPHGQAQFGGDGEARSRAASVFPGVGAQEGPALGWGQACGQGFPCEEFFPDGGFPPPYPLTAEAENPRAQEARPTFAGQQVGEPGSPFSFTIVDVVATATDEEATTRAVIADLNLLPVAAASEAVPGLGGATAANPAAVAVKNLVSTTTLRLKGNELVAVAESKLSGISLFGGAVQIDRLTARSVSRADADNHLTNEPTVTVEGVTAGDVPLVITDKGVAVAGETVDQGAIQTLSTGVGALFGAGPVSVRLIDSTEDRREGIAKGSAVGLSVHFEVNASGFPSGKKIVGDLILGTAATTASASGDAFGGNDDIVFDDEFSLEDGSGFESFGDGGEEFTFVAGETIEQGDGGGPQVAAGVQGGRRPQQARFAPLETLLQGVAADRMTLLYVAWTLALVGLAFGSRLPGIRFASHR
ncbi:MAG TPA: hypothetical protein VI854_05110 [Acidimicrobiia bacterium]|nr:hypothetical protein [Acidimicrobiia bacterium]